MVHGMLGWRDEDAAQQPIERMLEPQIGVRIQRDHGCRQQVDPYRGGRQAQCGDQGHHDDGAEDEFQRMVPFGGRDVDLRIAVMNQVYAPQQRDAMEEPVFPIAP